MKIIKQHSFESARQIWKILISESDKLLLETRDINSKDVFFHCYDLANNKVVFSNLQLQEKFWIGIESIHNETAFFHKYPKPDLPGHKEIVALDINSSQIIWTNQELSFLFLFNDKVYGFQQGFEDRYFVSLNYRTGEMVENLGTDYLKVNRIREQAENIKKWESYLYPKKFTPDEKDGRISELLNAETSGLDLEGDVEYNILNDLLLMNFHTKVSDSNFTNNFSAINLTSGKKILSEILNLNSSSLFTDSFFIYRNFLFLLKEKNEIVIHRLEED